MKITIFLMLLTTATALATTHVNISFTQQHSSIDSNIAELRSDQVKLKEPTDSVEQFNNEDKSPRFARIKVEDKKEQIELTNNQNVVKDVNSNRESTANYRTERVQSEEREGYFGSHSQNQKRTFYNPNREVHQSHGQFRSLSPQDKQNMEFERYIHSYHSGPTVETVYESAKPEMQHTLASSSVHEGAQRAVKFERQVALPTKVESSQPSVDVGKPIPNHQPVATPSVAAPPSPPALPPSKPGVSVSSPSGSGFKINLNQKPTLLGKDSFNFDLSYNKPNYNDPTYKYNDGHSDAHFYNQFPPAVEEPHGGYGDYYGSVYNRQQGADSYHPVEQRPVVTKTIQIAQPAIKAKKYEVRHPAIQKEFYDIEERVVIKPAGTVVVELERPSAKILKEETTLPLGHPHPAVAAAYMNNRNTQTFSNLIYSNAGSSSNHPTNQYIPHQTYSNKNVPDHQSSSASTYDQSSKDVGIAESTQNKAYIGESHFAAATADDSPKPQHREIVVLTDGHGNQRQISADQFTYSRDETDKAAARPVYSHRNYEDKARSTAQTNISPHRTTVQSNQDTREDLSFDAEYINTASKSDLRKESKPARLQEASSERVVEQKQQTQQQPIIKHEHKIVLSPSQHNIYLSRNQELPKTKFIEETAKVREINPYLQNHRGPVVVYAQAKQMPELKYVQRPAYAPAARVSSQVVQYHNSNQRSQLAGQTDNRVQYSAPYSQMRLNSDEEQNKNEKKSEKLILENDKPVADVKKPTMESTMEKQAPQAHVEIKIPNDLSNNANKAIFVASTIRPMMMDDGREQMHNSKLEISVTSNGEPKQESASKDEVDKSKLIDTDKDESKKANLSDKDSEYLPNIKTKADCDQQSKTMTSENYELVPEQNNRNRQQKFMRIVEGSSSVSAAASSDGTSSAESAAVQTNIQPHNIDVNVKSTAGHVSPPGSRVLASTAAPKESTPSESFHKRRIVVNHPFQTVREVVEHEPYTNYHEVQVNEPATPALYQSANYYQPENRHYYN